MLSRSEHLLLPSQFLSDMIQHAQSELPNECCGLLAGVHEADTLRALGWYPLVNQAASPVEYLSEPRSMFDATKKMRQHGWEIVAVYHSHPTSAPIPSKTDLARLFSTDVVHFIIGLSGPEPVIRGWWLTETTFEEAVSHILEK